MAATVAVLTYPRVGRYARRQWQKVWIFRQKKAKVERERLRRSNTLEPGLGQVGRTGTMGSVIRRRESSK